MKRVNLKKLVFLAIILISIPVFSQNAKKFYKTGLEFVAAENFTDAIDQFTKALELDPDFSKAYVERAIAYEQIGKLSEAADDFTRASVFMPKNSEVFYHSGRLFYELGKYDDALKMLTQSFDLNYRNTLALQERIKTYIALEDYEKAIDDCNSAILLDKKDPKHYYYRGIVNDRIEEFEKAESDLDQAIILDRKYIQAFIDIAKVRFKLKKLDNALANCNSAIKLDPNNIEAYIVRAMVYREQLDYPNAINDLSKVTLISPDDEEIFYTRGIYYQEFSQHQNAINDFNKVISLNDEHSLAYYQRASCYEEILNYAAALKDYEKLASLSEYDVKAKQLLAQAEERLFELNRESNKPEINLLDPAPKDDFVVDIAGNKTEIIIKGKISDESDMECLIINNKNVHIEEDGADYKFLAGVDISDTEKIFVSATDVYGNVQEIEYTIRITEIVAPEINLIAPYASDNGEIFLSGDNSNLYIEGAVTDESLIESILIEDISASYRPDEINPTFAATINVSNKNNFTVKAVDIYGNVTEEVFKFTREEMSYQDNPMGKTWVVFIENSNYETFASLDGPTKDITMMKAALANYQIHNIIHKMDMAKEDLEKFFAIELRDMVRSNHVNSLLVWYAGHGKFINESGYWVPVDAQRDDEFTYFNINSLKASMQSYSEYVTHTLVVTDACESGPTFYQAMRSIPEEKSCDDWTATRFKSSQVFSSAGYELAVDNSQFTETFANTLTNNPNACIPIEKIVSQVTVAVAKNNQQRPKFGKIAGLQDEDGTFFFILKDQ